MLEFDVELVEQGSGRWAAWLDGQLLLTAREGSRARVAEILLRNGADPRCRLVFWRKGRVVASDLVGVVAGGWESGDVGAMERDCVR